MKWELINDGYHKESRFVDEATGKIIGGVSGTNYDSKAEWYAYLKSGPDPHIGYYVTEGQAKRAVERAAKTAASDVDPKGQDGGQNG